MYEYDVGSHCQKVLVYMHKLDVQIIMLVNNIMGSCLMFKFDEFMELKGISWAYHL